jgi:hypothetical protein
MEAVAKLREQHTIVSADSGYHSEANLKELEAKASRHLFPTMVFVSAMPAMRARSITKVSLTRCGASPKAANSHGNRPERFQSIDDFSHCICPACRRLYRNGTNCNIGGRHGARSTPRSHGVFLYGRPQAARPGAMGGVNPLGLTI